MEHFKAMQENILYYIKNVVSKSELKKSIKNSTILPKKANLRLC